MRICKLLWRKAVRPLKKAWAFIILNSKKIEARWLHNLNGGTYYVVMLNWHDIRVFNKPKYEYCKKFIKKKYGKELSRHVIYRADGTLIRNPNSLEELDK